MKIVVLDGYALNPGDLSWDAFRELGDFSVYDYTAAEDTLERAKGSEIVITNKTVIRRETIQNLPDLKYVGLLSTGSDAVDVEFAKSKGITVCNIPSYCPDAVAQMVFALLLELCSKVGLHSNAVLNGEWCKSTQFSFWKAPLIELSGKTMGIIGYGNIGRRTAQIAKAFGMNVIVNSRTKSDGFVSLNELFKKADVVSLHCPLTAETENIINENSLKLMKPSAFLINTSRGKLINDKDLAYALNNNLLMGAGLDVLSTEPPNESNPLLSAKNCIITPHIAWAVFEARERLMQMAFQNLTMFLKGSPQNIV